LPIKTKIEEISKNNTELMILEEVKEESSIFDSRPNLKSMMVNASMADTETTINIKEEYKK
jgi:hypothetical protein